MVRSVFLSSTFVDFKEERQRLINNIPLCGFHVICAEHVGRGTANSIESSIKMWIDKSDAIILLIGLKYGTEADDGISYTEKEFRYALEKGKPIFCYFREHSEVDRTKIDIPQKLLRTYP